MSSENQSNSWEREIVPDKDQTLYSEAFISSHYPLELFPESEVYQDSPEAFSAKFIRWKEKFLADIHSSIEGGNLSNQLENVSLFEIFKVSEQRLMEAEFQLNAYDLEDVVRRSFQSLMRNVDYWNWIHTNSYLASQLWKNGG